MFVLAVLGDRLLSALCSALRSAMAALGSLREKFWNGQYIGKRGGKWRLEGVAIQNIQTKTVPVVTETWVCVESAPETADGRGAVAGERRNKSWHGEYTGHGAKWHLEGIDFDLIHGQRAPRVMETWICIISNVSIANTSYFHRMMSLQTRKN